MRKVYETGDLENALEFAQQEVYDLQDQMSSAADNMPEQLNKTHAEAAQLLDVAWHYVSDSDVPPALRGVEVTWVEWKGKIHRPQRRDNVVNFLRAYLAKVQQTDDTKRLVADLQSAIEALNNVFFPGMSGRRAA